MSSARLALLLAAPWALACGSSSHPGSTFQVRPGDNVVALSVNGLHCGSTPYLNKPCVSVTICEPGTTTCQTIDDVLLDTGSYGLRVYRQVLTGVALPQVAAADGGALATCVQFADGTSDWGPVQLADVVLGNEPPARVPIQVIDSGFGAVPSTCTSPETGPTTQNGFLGVGAFVEDCGAPCATPSAAGAGIYFSWDGARTSGVAVPTTSQIQNPVALLPQDNNGVIVSIPSVPASGAPSVEGALVLGIGTRANNQPAGATAMALDGAGEFTTTIDGGATQDGSFADTGSNGLFFDAPSPLAACTSVQGWYCPATTQSFVATNRPSAGYPGGSARVPFQIGNVEALLSRGAAVIPTAGGSGVPGMGFDWGLPFFLGRTVYVGFDGRTSPIGAGPAIAY